MGWVWSVVHLYSACLLSTYHGGLGTVASLSLNQSSLPPWWVATWFAHLLMLCFFFFDHGLGMWSLSSLTRNWTCAACAGSVESWPLDHHVSKCGGTWPVVKAGFDITEDACASVLPGTWWVPSDFKSLFLIGITEYLVWAETPTSRVGMLKAQERMFWQENRYYCLPA